jgi:serine 3-dehydrogenase
MRTRYATRPHGVARNLHFPLSSRFASESAMSAKTILVTGASAGFGAATARRFAQAGWHVVACARRLDRLQHLVDEFGANVHIAAFDIRDADAMQAALDALPAEFRAVDVLVNNAGLALGTAKAPHCDLAQWRQMIDTNITALATLTHKLLPTLIERRGTIVNVSSISATYPYTGGNVYGGTKSFVTQFSLGLRCDLHGSGVHVTSVEPGMAETEFTLVRTGGDQAASDKLYQGTHPITGHDIAETIWWIANLPAHLNVNRIEVMPVTQSFAGLQVARD